MGLLGLYVLFGAGVYVGVACSRLASFRDATKFAIFRGILLGFFLWPVGIAIVATEQQNRKHTPFGE